MAANNSTPTHNGNQLVSEKAEGRLCVTWN